MKEDIRSKLSRTIIKNALLELLKRKSIYDITVKELCDAADINRSTFYRHYNNISDVMDEITDNISGVIAKVNEWSIQDPNNALNYIYESLRFLEQHQEYDSLMVSEHFSFDILFGKLEGTVLKTLATLTNHTGNELNYMVKYILRGTLAIIREWIKGGRRDSASYIARLIYRVSANAVGSF